MPPRADLAMSPTTCSIGTLSSSPGCRFTFSWIGHLGYEPEHRPQSSAVLDGRGAWTGRLGDQSADHLCDVASCLRQANLGDDLPLHRNGNDRNLGNVDIIARHAP